MDCSLHCRIARWLAAGLLVALSSGCFGPSFEWREIDVGEVHLGDAWTAVEEIAKVDGFPVDPAGTDRGLREFTSRWRTSELPFRRSNRRRVHARFERTDDNGWLIRYYVEQQTVEDISKSFDPEDRDWSAAGQDAETENRFTAKLKSRFEGASVPSR